MATVTVHWIYFIASYVHMPFYGISSNVLYKIVFSSAFLNKNRLIT